jgi:hypothetical protein
MVACRFFADRALFNHSVHCRLFPQPERSQLDKERNHEEQQDQEIGGTIVCLLIAWPQFGPGELFRSSAAARAQNFSPEELDGSSRQ